MPTLNRDDILNSLDLMTDVVPIPRWGGDVLVKAMPMASRRYIQYVTAGATSKKPISIGEDKIRRYVGAVIMSALDPQTEATMFAWKDADAIRDKHWNSVVMIANKAFELAGDTPEEKEAWHASDDDEVELVLDDSDEDDAVRAKFKRLAQVPDEDAHDPDAETEEFVTDEDIEDTEEADEDEADAPLAEPATK